MIRQALAFLLTAALLQAHVGSPDIFFEGKAGAYELNVVIRPPAIIPGIAEVEIRTPSTNIREIKVVPYPLVGVASKYPPTPDSAQRSATDPRNYTASVWLMAFGSYQIRIDVDGADARGSLSIPVPSVARETKEMPPGLGWILALLMILIVVGAISIAGAAARESTLPAAQLPDPAHRRRSRITMIAATAAFAGILLLGNWWWGVEASGYRAHVYKQPAMQVSLQNGTLTLQLEPTRKPNDYLPDHGHLMHLFVIRTPEMDRMWHLHPELTGNSEFKGPAPALPAGHYKLFADIVHASGFPETPIADLDVPQATAAAQPLTGDDAEGSAPPLNQFDSQKSIFILPDNYRVVRAPQPQPIAARQMLHLNFEVQAPSGEPATDLEPYLGMAAHAEFISADAAIFAHTHPSGTVPMASLGLTPNAFGVHENMEMTHNRAQLTFPYGFPKPGRYRMFLQIQRAGHPETAAFDYDVK